MPLSNDNNTDHKTSLFSKRSCRQQLKQIIDVLAILFYMTYNTSTSSCKQAFKEDLEMTEYPYMTSNNKIAKIIESLQSAARPPKFTLDFLRNMGYTSTNDRGIVPLLKRLGFLTDDSIPTVYYDQLRDKTTYKKILAARIRELYSELFTINTEIYRDNEANVKGAISRVTGGNEVSVKRVYGTFKSLCSIADFTQAPAENSIVEESAEDQMSASKQIAVEKDSHTEFHYNIQIHLPATTDISVYNSIFKSLKENLLI